MGLCAWYEGYIQQVIRMNSSQFSSTTHPFPLNNQNETSLLLKLHFVMSLYIKAFNILIYMVIDDCKVKFNLVFIVTISTAIPCAAGSGTIKRITSGFSLLLYLPFTEQKAHILTDSWLRFNHSKGENFKNHFEKLRKFDNLHSYLRIRHLRGRFMHIG